MSDQDMEMQFADPDWQPAPARQGRSASEKPLSVPQTPDPRQQADQPGSRNAYKGDEGNEGDKANDYADYSQGYRAASSNDAYNDTSQEAAHMPRQRARPRRGPWLWILALIILIALFANPVGEDVVLLFWRVLVAIVIVGALFALFLAVSRSRRGVSSSETRTFSVGTQPRITVKNDAGSIRVHPGGEDSQVVVQATRRGRTLLGSETGVYYDQHPAKNSVTVKARGGWSFIGSRWVDFDITVPRSADLELMSDAGSITVNGIDGQISCITPAGSVNVSDAWLRGNSKLKTDAGTVSFSGSLDPRGSYQMTTDAGNVSVTLPPGASFRLDAKTDVGSINSDFPLTIQRDFPGGKARCDVGPPPYPTLKLRTDVGSINIRQAEV